MSPAQRWNHARPQGPVQDSASREGGRPDGLSAEERIARLTRFYTALSSCNEAIYRAHDVLAMSRAVCEIVVTHGRLLSCAVRMYDPSRRILLPFAGHGPLRGWIGGNVISLDDPRSRASLAARELTPYFSNDVLNDATVAVAHEEARRLGVRASGGIPLEVDGELIGLWSVYGGEVGFFDDELNGLLVEIGRSLSFGFSKHRAEKGLRASEEHYRLLFNETPEAIRVSSGETVVMLNPAAAQLLGVDNHEALIGMPVADSVAPSYREMALARLREVEHTRRPATTTEQRLLRADGTQFEAEVETLPLEYDGKPAALSFLRDLTQRKATQRRINRLTSLYAALSRTNESIFRYSEPRALCAAVCEIAVREGGLMSAAVRVLDESTGRLERYAGFGPLHGRIGAADIEVGDMRSSAARVWREGSTFVTHDFISDPQVADAHDDAELLGVRSCAILPLSDEGRRIGVLAVFAAEPSFFDPELQSLVEEIARNLSFGFARSRAAAALEVSEDRYRALFESCPDAIAVIRNGNFVMLNPAAVSLLGASSRAQLIGTPAADVVDPAYREMSRQRLKVVLDGQTVAPAEFPMLRLDGAAPVLVEAVALPFDYEGQPAVLSFLHDLTLRRAAQQRISRLTSLYAALSRTNEAIFRINDLKRLCQAVCEIAVAHGGLISAAIRAYNPQAGTLEPYCGAGPLLGALGTTTIELGDPNSTAALVAREGGYSVRNDLRHDPRSTDSVAEAVKIGVHAVACFALTAEGVLAGVLSVYAGDANFFDDELTGLLDELAHNLSFAFSRQRAAADLRRSEEHYRMLFNAAPDAMRVTCGGRIVMLNPAAARLLGLDSVNEVLGLPMEVTVAPEFRAASLERLRFVIQERRALPPMEMRALRRDGSTVECEVVSLPIEYEGEPAALTIIHDLTERKASERAMQRMNAELEERVTRRTTELRLALDDLEAFSYTVAHDLRSPLRRMNGFAALLRDSLGARVNDEEKMFLERITDGAQTMDRLIEGLLEIAHLGRAQIKLSHVDLSGQVKSLAAEMQARDPGRQVEFRIEPDVTAWADPRLIHDVLENLLSNAWKFTSGHASARIEFGTLPRQEGAQGAELSCYVRDDGAGFDPRYADKLFGTFQRLHTQNEFSGTGIGLASVKRIIGSHGGRVWAQGEVEKGATFYFSLPVREGN